MKDKLKRRLPFIILAWAILGGIIFLVTTVKLIAIGAVLGVNPVQLMANSPFTTICLFIISGPLVWFAALLFLFGAMIGNIVPILYL